MKGDVMEGRKNYRRPILHDPYCGVVGAFEETTSGIILWGMKKYIALQ